METGRSDKEGRRQNQLQGHPNCSGPQSRLRLKRPTLPDKDTTQQYQYKDDHIDQCGCIKCQICQIAGNLHSRANTCATYPMYALMSDKANDPVEKCRVLA